VHLAALDPGGEVVGTAVLLPERFERMPDRADAWRLRGMATEARLRGQGVGSQLVRRVIEQVAARGGGLLWCYARVPAQAFYERAGFTAVGDRWEEPHLGPHVAMWREVSAAGPSD
jgi:predicted GNAT family N-acyltransferase